MQKVLVPGGNHQVPLALIKKHRIAFQQHEAPDSGTVRWLRKYAAFKFEKSGCFRVSGSNPHHSCESGVGRECAVVGGEGSGVGGHESVFRVCLGISWRLSTETE